MNEEEFEFEINDFEIIEHFKEIITPKKSNIVEVDLTKLAEDIQSKMIDVECNKKDEHTVNIAYTVNPVLCEVILEAYNKFLNFRYDLEFDNEKAIEDFIDYITTLNLLGVDV